MSQWASLLKDKTTVTAVAVTASVIATVVLLSKLKRKKYVLVGKVSALTCYPVKSLGGITGDEAFCSVSGIKISNTLDRRFVVVRPNGDFVTQRQIPRMAGIKIVSDGENLVFTASGMPEIQVPLRPALDRQKVVPCRVWKNHAEAQDCGQEIASWLSEYLKEDLRLLVLAPGLKLLPCEAENTISKDKIAFPDKGPLHIATEESFADVLSRIGPLSEGTITVHNFRPNIVIQCATKAWDEDNWSHLKIGQNVQMRVLEPCDRCVMTTVNPETLDRRPDEEPLKTLRSFRTFPEVSKSPLFGFFVGVDVEDTIRINDPVYAVYK